MGQPREIGKDRLARYVAPEGNGQDRSLGMGGEVRGE